MYEIEIGINALVILAREGRGGWKQICFFPMNLFILIGFVLSTKLEYSPHSIFDPDVCAFVT
jgi:hypothetical protein